MQLTKDDLYKILKPGYGNIVEGRGIDFSKFQQVVEFYEKYANSEGYIKTMKTVNDMENEDAPWNRLYEDHPEIAKEYMKSNMDYDAWLFSYCFKEGLK